MLVMSISLARPIIAARRVQAIANCPNNGGWRHERQMRICHDFSGLFQCYCPEYGPSRDTAQGKKRRFYRNNFDFGAGGRTGQHARNGELADIFCRWATDATPAMASKGWANGGLRFTGEIFFEGARDFRDRSLLAQIFSGWGWWIFHDPTSPRPLCQPT